MSDYWTATDDYLKEHGGKGPICSCGSEMVPQDDHGRFVCFDCGYGMGSRIKFPQVTKEMPDEEKKKIPPLNRLNLEPTKEERKLLEGVLKGMNGQ